MSLVTLVSSLTLVSLTMLSLTLLTLLAVHGRDVMLLLLLL